MKSNVSLTHRERTIRDWALTDGSAAEAFGSNIEADWFMDKMNASGGVTADMLTHEITHGNTIVHVYTVRVVRIDGSPA